MVPTPPKPVTSEYLRLLKDFVDKKYLTKDKFIYTIINENALVNLAKELEL
jgi:hypothetical protein